MDAQDGNYTYYLGGVDTAPNPDTVKVSMADTDFLTELRVYLYARIFAGIGFDISIVALKVGIFGQIDADMQFQWLNRPYLGGENKGMRSATWERRTPGIKLFWTASISPPPAPRALNSISSSSS